MGLWLVSSLVCFMCWRREEGEGGGGRYAEDEG